MAVVVMSRQRLPIGTHGEVTVMNLPDGRVEVHTRYRDWDGKARLVSVRAASRSAVQAELKEWLAQRNVFQPIDTMLCLDSLFGELVTYWLADLDLEGRIAPSTRFNYERDMTKLVLPAFEHLTLREIGVARCDAVLKRLGEISYSSSRRAKTVLRLAFGLAVRHEVVPRNPIDGVARLHKPKRTPTGDRGQRDPCGHQGVGAQARYEWPEPGRPAWPGRRGHARYVCPHR